MLSCLADHHSFYNTKRLDLVPLKAVTGLDRESAHLLQLNSRKRSCCTASYLGVTDVQTRVQTLGYWDLGLKCLADHHLFYNTKRLDLVPLKAVTGLDRESTHLLQLNSRKRSCCTASYLGVTDVQTRVQTLGN